jgi:hypothetical protein
MRIALDCSGIGSIGLARLPVDDNVNRSGTRLGNFLIVRDEHLRAGSGNGPLVLIQE